MFIKHFLRSYCVLVLHWVLLHTCLGADREDFAPLGHRALALELEAELGLTVHTEFKMRRPFKAIHYLERPGASSRPPRKSVMELGLWATSPARLSRFWFVLCCFVGFEYPPPGPSWGTLI